MSRKKLYVGATLVSAVLVGAGLAMGQSAQNLPGQATTAQVPRPVTPQGVPGVPTRPPVLTPQGPIRAQPGTVAPRPGSDQDGDGYPVEEDCDDRDASRFPQNTETANDRDEDCNPATFGTRDDDRDGYLSGQISNYATYGVSASGGDDCDDRQAGIRPDAQELPNRIDDNCDGIVDNLLGRWWTPPGS